MSEVDAPSALTVRRLGRLFHWLPCVFCGSVSADRVEVVTGRGSRVFCEATNACEARVRRDWRRDHKITPPVRDANDGAGGLPNRLRSCAPHRALSSRVSRGAADAMNERLG